MDNLTPDDMNRIGEAIAYQNKLDYDGTGPKAPHGDITYKGVVLSSRYDVKNEFDEMKRVIDSMSELMARRIDSIWCDSKACACFIVQIHPQFFVEDLPYEIEDAFKNTLGGYNGLSIECDGRKIPYRDCYWPADEAEFEDRDNASEEVKKIEF
jgi:hypothetical protein